MSIPVYAQTDRSKFLDQMKSWEKILEQHPDMVLVISLGVPEQLAMKDGEIHIPDLVVHMVKEYQVLIELGYPISMGKALDYPYSKAQELIRSLYEAFGPKKLVWGSDIPNTERYCTYAQSLSYMTEYCDFLNKEDLELILEKNVLSIFRFVT
jgi:predicted TIM-barrel fold metal-dependent hydrolase